MAKRLIQNTMIHIILSRKRPMVIRFALYCFWLGFLLRSADASDSPTIEFVESPAIQRGTIGDLRVIGANLDGVNEVIFYEPGIECRSIEGKNDEELAVRLEIHEYCTTGIHAFRLRSNAGFSELRTFSVTPFPVVREVDIESELKIGTSLLGDLNDGHADRFRIWRDKGQILAIDIEAIRMGIDMIDLAIVVRDPMGNTVGQADDSELFHQDPAISLVANQSGDYSIDVINAGRNPGERAVYLMHMHDGPCPSSVFPLGGQSGTAIDLTFQGDCLGMWVSTYTLPNIDDPLPFQLFAKRNGRTASTAIPFRISRLANVMEMGENDTWEIDSDLAPIKAPVALNGILAPAGDIDRYWLQALAGQKLDIEVFAQRLGSAADTLISVVDSQSNVLAISDDVDSLDSRVELRVPKDGRFGIAIEEKRGKGGDQFTYRIEVNVSQSTAEVFLPRRVRESQELQTIAIPQGNRILALMAVRKDDETGEAILRFPQLPEGVKPHFTQPKFDQAVVPVVFEASENAKLEGQLLPVEVSVHTPFGTTLGAFHQVTDLVRGPADAIYCEHHADRMALCVREPYAISVAVEQPDAMLFQDGTLDLVVHVTRRPEFEGEVVLSLPWLPPWISAEPRVSVPADKTQVTIPLRAWKQADTTSWPIVVEAAAGQSPSGRRARETSSSTNSGSTSPDGLLPSAVASLPIQLTVAQPPATASFMAAAAEQGNDVEIVCKLEATDQLRSFRDLVASIEGLPNRVSCEPISISSQSQNITFRVHLDSTAPIGIYDDLACRLSGTFGDENVSFVVARDGALTIDEPGRIMRDESGRALNRLEALRKRTEQRKEKTDVR